MTQSQELENRIARDAKTAKWLLLSLGALMVVDVVILIFESHKLLS